LDAFGKIYSAQVKASGVIPQIQAVFGLSGGGMAVSNGLSDFVFMERDKAKIFVNSPNAIDKNSQDKNDYEKTFIIDHIGNGEVAKNLGDFIRCSNIVTAEVKKDQSKKIGKKKQDDSGNVEYVLPAAMIMRNYLHDREFPLESVMLSSTETKHNEDIGKVKIHIGAYADEYARHMHAMAFTIGSTIFFRNGSYKPESEEGRALLAHEMKHISQNREYMTADNRTKEELEAEKKRSASARLISLRTSGRFCLTMRSISFSMSFKSSSVSLRSMSIS